MRSARFTGFLFFVLAACGAAFGATGARYANIPLAFERHEVASEAHYVAHGNGYSIDIFRGGARMILPGARKNSTSVISLEFRGGARPVAAPEDQLPGKANYILGRDP